MLVKFHDVKFIDILFIASRVMCGYRQVNMAKQIDAFLRIFFAHGPKRSPRIGTKLDYQQLVAALENPRF
jgi:hypothetical protein